MLHICITPAYWQLWPTITEQLGKCFYYVEKMLWVKSNKQTKIMH